MILELSFPPRIPWSGLIDKYGVNSSGNPGNQGFKNPIGRTFLSGNRIFFSRLDWDRFSAETKPLRTAVSNSYNKCRIKKDPIHAHRRNIKIAFGKNGQRKCQDKENAQAKSGF
jgi:hypothetical protein